MSLTLHEFAHAWMSNFLGDSTARSQGRLTLNPLAHIDPVMTVAVPLLLIISGSPIVFGAARPVPFNPWAVRYGKWGAALVAAAGPATNLLLAVFFALWLHLQPDSALFKEMIIVNVGFMVFNLIPFPPLDGSRILYAAAPPQLRDLMDRIEHMGMTALLLFFALYFFVLAPFVGALMVLIIHLLAPAISI